VPARVPHALESFSGYANLGINTALSTYAICVALRWYPYCFRGAAILSTAFSSTACFVSIVPDAARHTPKVRTASLAAFGASRFSGPASGINSQSLPPTHVPFRVGLHSGVIPSVASVVSRSSWGRSFSFVSHGTIPLLYPHFAVSPSQIRRTVHVNIVAELQRHYSKRLPLHF